MQSVAGIGNGARFFLQPLSTTSSNISPTTTQPSFVSNPRTIPTQLCLNHNSTTRKRMREAAAESSSSWSLGEYAVSIRSDFRSPASLPPRPQHAADATRRYPTLFRHSHLECPCKIPVSMWNVTDLPGERKRCWPYARQYVRPLCSAVAGRHMPIASSSFVRAIQRVA